MSLRRRGSGTEAVNPWPGYVDALSTLLMVIIFVLLVFVLAQAFLSVTLSGRDAQLDRLNRQMAELSDMLSLQRGRGTELQQSVSQLTLDLQAANRARDAAGAQVASLQSDQAKLLAERDALRSEKDRLAARLADAGLQVQSADARTAALTAQLNDAARSADAQGRQDAAAAAAVAAQLAQARHDLASLQAERDALDRTVTADRATIEARLSDLAKMADQVRALSALRDELERQSQDAAVRATTAEQRAAAVAAQLAQEAKLGDSARAQIALLSRQTEELRAQMASVAAALDAAEANGRDKDAQIANLGSRLNAALAQKVEELQAYRSEFFGRLRQVLSGRSGVQVVGDRFVFQSEVLFPVGSADTTPAGADQITALAATVKQIAAEIPPDVHWILRVDGHADRQPVDRGRFASNWELSAQRAINVVKLLIQDGVAADHLAATAFGDNQPLDPSDTPDAFARNRRIEIRLTDR